MVVLGKPKRKNGISKFLVHTEGPQGSVLRHWSEGTPSASAVSSVLAIGSGVAKRTQITRCIVLMRVM